MTLQKLLDTIASYGIQRKIINFSAAGTSVYELSRQTVKEYPLLFACPAGTHYATIDTTTYSITFYYIDRLLDDSSNDIDIFSTAIEQLKNLIRGIDALDGVVSVSDEIRLDNFAETERLSDRCAGAYATVQVTVVNEVICAE